MPYVHKIVWQHDVSILPARLWIYKIYKTIVCQGGERAGKQFKPVCLAEANFRTEITWQFILPIVCQRDEWKLFEIPCTSKLWMQSSKTEVLWIPMAAKSLQCSLCKKLWSCFIRLTEHEYVHPMIYLQANCPSETLNDILNDVYQAMQLLTQLSLGQWLELITFLVWTTKFISNLRLILLYFVQWL